MKLLKILISFIALVSLQIAAAQWLNVPPPAEAKNLMVVGGGVSVVGGASCPADGSPSATYAETGADVQSISLDTGVNGPGGNIYTAPATKSICKVGLKLSLGGGSISGLTFTVNIYNTDNGTVTGLVTNGTSSGVTGSNSWNATWVYFSFSTPPTVTSATVYIIVVGSSTPGETNFATINYLDPGGETVTQLTKYNIDIGEYRTDFTTRDGAMKVYYYE